jgi:DNA-directed RNA polymerase subunit RPC12/RpoP
MTEYHCPNCGTSFGPQLASTRMMNCESCGTSVFIEDDRLRLAGSQGVMHEGPTLMALHDTVELGWGVVRVLGHARFSYGRGTWDEFWAVGRDGQGVWVSVDEGDVVVQSEVDRASWPSSSPDAQLGAEIRFRGQRYRATEIETAVCEAVRGSLPELIVVGESHRFVNFTGEDGGLLSGEFWSEGEAWFVGAWEDPFDLKARAS